MMKLLGHRGVVLKSALPYQNTAPAYELALQHADGFECDVCISADGEIFLVHESIVKDGKVHYHLSEHLEPASIELLKGRRLDEMSSAEIEELHTPGGEPLPKLKDVVSLFTHSPQKILNLELKAYGTVSALVKTLKHAFETHEIQADQVIVSSFNHPELLMIREQLPQVQIGFLMSAPDDARINTAPWHESNQGYYEPLREEYLSEQLFAQIKPEWMIFPSEAATQKNVDMIHMHHPNIKVATWVRSEAEEDPILAAKRLMNGNVNIDLLIVDTPHILFP